MQAFTTWKGTAASLLRANIDTDQIIPKQFLTTVTRAGLGDYLFDSWRFADPGVLGKKPKDRLKNPEFVLNKPEHAGASILLAGVNFGCGSSREHASWSMLDYGIRVVIAPDFADIFYANAIANGLLPAVVEPDALERLAECVAHDPSAELVVDLAKQQIMCASQTVAFSIDPASKTRLLKGQDAITSTLEYAEAIRTFEAQHLTRYPWLGAPISTRA